MNIISDNTAVSIGLLLGLLGFAGGAVWWAASVNTKLEQLVALAMQMVQLKDDVNDLDKRVTVLEEKQK